MTCVAKFGDPRYPIFQCIFPLYKKVKNKLCNPSRVPSVTYSASYHSSISSVNDKQLSIIFISSTYSSRSPRCRHPLPLHVVQVCSTSAPSGQRHCTVVTQLQIPSSLHRGFSSHTRVRRRADASLLAVIWSRSMRSSVNYKSTVVRRTRSTAARGVQGDGHRRRRGP